MMTVAKGWTLGKTKVEYDEICPSAKLDFTNEIGTTWSGKIRCYGPTAADADALAARVLVGLDATADRALPKHFSTHASQRVVTEEDVLVMWSAFRISMMRRITWTPGEDATAGMRDALRKALELVLEFRNEQ